MTAQFVNKVAEYYDFLTHMKIYFIPVMTPDGMRGIIIGKEYLY